MGTTASERIRAARERRDAENRPALVDVDMRVIPDDNPDASYLEQDEFADRLEEYRRGDFGFVGVCAAATILLSGGITQTITTPGLWGIEDDSGDEYFRTVYEEELETLRAMLAELNVSGVAGSRAVAEFLTASERIRAAREYGAQAHRTESHSVCVICRSVGEATCLYFATGEDADAYCEARANGEVS